MKTVLHFLRFGNKRLRNYYQCKAIRKMCSFFTCFVPYAGVKMQPVRMFFIYLEKIFTQNDLAFPINSRFISFQRYLRIHFFSKISTHTVLCAPIDSKRLFILVPKTRKAYIIYFCIEWKYVLSTTNCQSQMALGIGYKRSFCLSSYLSMRLKNYSKIPVMILLRQKYATQQILK